MLLMKVKMLIRSEGSCLLCTTQVKNEKVDLPEL